MPSDSPLQIVRTGVDASPHGCARGGIYPVTVTSSPQSRPAMPVTSVRPAPEAWRHALLLADGDHSRLTGNADGTVSVANKPVRGGPGAG